MEVYKSELWHTVVKWGSVGQIHGIL
jgi:hypothetical protein